jgi:sulfite exporter TauE/SafE
MCGPVAAASAGGRRSGSLSYVGGRVVSYTLLGSLAGGLGKVVTQSSWARPIELLVSLSLATFLLLSGVRQLLPRRERLIPLGKSARRTWTGRVLAQVADEPLLLGAATALLPCGALFAALSAAATLGTSLRGALLMATFALLTGGVLFGVRGLSAKLAATNGMSQRGLLAAVLLIGAVVTAARPVSLLTGSAQLPCHGSQGAEP